MYKSFDQLGEQPENGENSQGPPPPPVIEITMPQQRAQLIASNRVVCVDVYADWCGPCKQTAPAYARMAQRYNRPGQCVLVKYNYERLEPADRAKVHGIPVFQFYVQGQQVDEVVGGDIPSVESKLKELLGITNERTASSPSGPQHNRNSIRNSRPMMPDSRYM